MIPCTSDGVRELLLWTRVPEPLGIVTSPWAMSVLISTEPFTPIAPGWMWAAIRTVPGGKPLMDATKSTVAAVRVFVLSLVRGKVIVTVPDPPDSAPPIGGTSLAGSIVAVNTGVLFGPVG